MRNRRAFLRSLAGATVGASTLTLNLASGSGTSARSSSQVDISDVKGTTLHPWRRGCLDIHHIATGRGDSSLVVAPDGTTIMIDAGAMYAPGPFNLDSKPDGGRRPGEWIGRYAARRLRETGDVGLDYLLVTHLHPDHVGDLGPGLPKASDGDYRLTGVSDVNAQVPVGVVLDRGAPDYANVDIRTAPFAQNYMRFIQARLSAGRRVERLVAGADKQIGLVRDARAFPTFDVRNLAVNGEVWTGRGAEHQLLFPPAQTLRPEDIPDENAYSAAIRLTYGRFSYFTAGDLTSNTFDGEFPWRDVESRAAQAAGPVDVAVASHHGLFDATGADVVRALRPRVWLIDAWHVSHPSITTLERLFSQRLYPGPREVFSTGLSQANSLVNDRLTKRLSSASGHVIVRVSPGGGAYRVVVTDNSDESDRVVQVFGPYESRSNVAIGGLPAAFARGSLPRLIASGGDGLPCYVPEQLRDFEVGRHRL
jgi:beta-lactamase superfamily II metal-dependent hydrolase